MTHLSFLLVLLGCNENGLTYLSDTITDLTPRLVVEPTFLDFGGQRSGVEVFRRFTLTNTGGALLELDDLMVEGTGAFTLLDDPEPFIEPGQTVSILTAFTPLVADEDQATVHVLSNGPVDPRARAQLVGTGLVPELMIDPNPWSFGELPVLCRDEVELHLSNVGYDDLIIDDLTLLGDSDAFLFSPVSTPIVLGPLDSFPVTLAFAPLTPGEHATTLEVHSNDPRGVRTADQYGAASYEGVHTETLIVPTSPPVDLLFAVDQSASMGDDATNLAVSFGAFITRVESLTSAWHLGVITYDSACANRGVLDATTPLLSERFAEAVVMGSDLEIADDEALLKLVDRALQQTGPGGCNEGLLRSDVPLHIVVVSDEPERSHEQASAWTWDYWVDRLTEAVDPPGLLRISGVVDASGCNEGDAGYREAITETGGEHLDICTTDWASHAAALAEAIVQQVSAMPLSHPADPASVVVTVDGEERWDWGWDGVRNAIVFDVPLEGGAVVEVVYGGVVECP